MESTKPRALFVGFESDQFNALVLQAAQTNFDVTALQGDAPFETFPDSKWDAVVIAFSPEHVQSNTVRSIVASWPDSVFYFVYPKGAQDSDLTRFLHGFLNGVTDRKKLGTIEYFIVESSQHALVAGNMGIPSSEAVVDDRSIEMAVPDEFTITFDPSLSAEQIEATLTALADFYRVCGGVGLAAHFEPQEAPVLVDSHA